MMVRARRGAIKSPTMIPLAASLAAALILSGCASTKRAIGTHTSATDAYLQPGSQAARDSADYWAKTYEANPQDKDNTLNYAGALRRNGQLEQAEAVLRKAIIKHESDRDIAAAYGKILAQAGKLPEALQVIRGAQTPTNPDWRLLSAEAAITDQLGHAEESRLLYTQALKIAPDEPSLLNNLGLSYLLAGDISKAEEMLRKAAASPKADSRIRQNLALALGLQGQFAEAEQVARTEIDPAQAEANIAYLKSMLSQRNSWAEIQSADNNAKAGG